MPLQMSPAKESWKNCNYKSRQTNNLKKTHSIQNKVTQYEAMLAD